MNRINLVFHDYYAFDGMRMPLGYYYAFVDQASKDTFDSSFPSYEYHATPGNSNLLLCANSIDDRVQQPDEMHSFTARAKDIVIKDGVVIFVSCAEGDYLSPCAGVLAVKSDYYEKNFIGRGGINGHILTGNDSNLEMTG